VSAKKAYRLQPPEGGWSAHAKEFLKVLGPIDLHGWHILANAPVQGWPAREIMAQMQKDPNLRAHIPIDIVGMVLDAVPDLYPKS
jgi:hypothetical protein